MLDRILGWATIAFATFVVMFVAAAAYVFMREIIEYFWYRKDWDE